MRFLRVVYVVAVAVVLVLLVIFGVEAFYPAPPYPDYPEPAPPPPYLDYPEPTPPHDTPEYEEWEQEWMQVQEEYQQKVAIHDRNIFFIVLPLGVLFAVGGTFIRRRVDIFGAGLILGGIGTMISAITPYDLDNMLRFAGIAATLAMLVFVGYKVFFSLRRS